MSSIATTTALRKWIKADRGVRFDTDRLDDDGLHVVTVMVAGLDDQAIARCEVLAKLEHSMEPERIIVNVPLGEYNELPTVEQWKGASA